MSAEFDRIARLFAPLATHPAARGLLDDVAVLDGRVWTIDAIVEGVHFLQTDPIGDVARKALRVNVSDVVAKGAAPETFLLSLAWPKGRSVADMEGFAAALGAEQGLWGCALVGGDTTATPGPLTISIAMTGRLLGARAPSRTEAHFGDDVWVSGMIGDAVLGLAVATGALAASEDDASYLLGRYRRPEPRAALAPIVAAHARASMDVSDGLLGDAAKIAAASKVKLAIDPELVPVSPAAGRWLASQPDAAAAQARLFSGGDDYEILFTAAPADRLAILAGADAAGVALTRIGAAEAGAGVAAGGLPIASYEHDWS